MKQKNIATNDGPRMGRGAFGPATLKPTETKSDLQRLIERVQLEILYRHSG